MRAAPMTRLMAKVSRDPSGCLLWTGGCSGPGYGRFWLAESLVLPHRFVYEQAIGPIPEGLVIDHLCGNPACVNVDHLEAVTPRANVHRSSNVAALNAQKTRCKSGHDFDTANTYTTPDGRRQCRTCRYEASRRSKSRQLVGATGA